MSADHQVICLMLLPPTSCVRLLPASLSTQGGRLSFTLEIWIDQLLIIYDNNTGGKETLCLVFWDPRENPPLSNLSKKGVFSTNVLLRLSPFIPTFIEKVFKSQRLHHTKYCQNEKTQYAVDSGHHYSVGKQLVGKIASRFSSISNFCSSVASLTRSSKFLQAKKSNRFE